MPQRDVASYTIVQGDTVVGLGYRFGLLPGTIWNHPANYDLKTLRHDMNVLLPGDVIYIPERQSKDVPRPVDQRHPFRRKGALALYRLQVFDFEQPRAGQAYTLIIDNTLTFRGTTDKSGTLEHYVPANARLGELTIGEDEARLEILFGHLDPLRETTGIQQRLRNLGFLAGEPDGVADERTEEALKVFQARFGLPVTGTVNEATLAKLQGMHDVVSEFPPEQPDTQPAAGSGDANART